MSTYPLQQVFSLSAQLRSEIPNSGEVRKFFELRVYQQHSNDRNLAAPAVSLDNRDRPWESGLLDLGNQLKAFIRKEQSQMLPASFAAEVAASPSQQHPSVSAQPHIFLAFILSRAFIGKWKHLVMRMCR